MANAELNNDRFRAILPGTHYLSVSEPDDTTPA